MYKHIINELRSHAPFTILGAATGILIMLPCYSLPSETSYNVFYILHPMHVVLSALATTSIYRLHKHKHKFWSVLLIGFVGSIGIATLSDSVIPYLGELLVGLREGKIHLGFIEEWWLVNPAALLGIVIACFWPRTKFPHSGHVLLSTWASSFHIIMALGGTLSWVKLISLFPFLFLAVWVPCCLSDIIFPVLFIREKDWE